MTDIFNKFHDKTKPKRILALDGGGIRGALTLGYLEKIETLLRARHDNSNLVLGDYYDLIGGTSTGAIIASCLAAGKEVKDVISLYTNLGKKVFGPRRYRLIPRSAKVLRSFLKASYKASILEKFLQENLCDLKMRDYGRLKCALAIVAKRADTYSAWTFCNHPDDDFSKANEHLKIWELCRASSAAPYYFAPKKLDVKTRSGKDLQTAFIDGGVSLANNPSFQLFQVASLPGFHFNWPTGTNKILITSLGTGTGVNSDSVDRIVNRMTLLWASRLPELFMTDALESNQLMLELFGHNLGISEVIDRRLEDLEKLRLVPEKLFSFRRCNVKLTVKDLKFLGFDKTDKEVASLVEMDHHENVNTLLEIGRKSADKLISDSDFPTGFNLA